MTREELIARLRYYACEDAEQGNVLTDAIAMLQRDGETIEKLRGAVKVIHIWAFMHDKPATRGSLVPSHVIELCNKVLKESTR